MGNLWINNSQYPSPGHSSRTPDIQGRYKAPTIKYISMTALTPYPKSELWGMRGITGAILVACLFSSEPKPGKPSKPILLLFTLVWILTSWDCWWLHTSNTTISLAIRTTPTITTLTYTILLAFSRHDPGCWVEEQCSVAPQPVPTQSPACSGPHNWDSMLHSDSKGIWTWPGTEGQRSGTHPADSYWLSCSHRYCWNGVQGRPKIKGSQTTRVWNRLWWPYGRHKGERVRLSKRKARESNVDSKDTKYRRRS